MGTTDPVADVKGKIANIGIAVIGYGYWGPNLVRNFSDLDAAQLLALSDVSLQRLMNVRRHRSMRTTSDYRDLLKMPDVDAIAIATPVSTHYELALASLRAGKHVLVEKPMTETFEQAMHLVEEATRRNPTLMVDHTFVYTPAVQKMRSLISEGAIGTPYYYESVRVNLGLFQQDVNVIWDLAVHDYAIIDHVLDQQPTAVSATGTSHVPNRPENIAYITLYFDSGLIAHINVNWLAPVKMRRTLVGSRIVDDLIEAGCGSIVVVDNMVRGRAENLAPAMRKAPVRLIEGDICDQPMMARLINDCDIVFHQAALRITHCAAEPRLAMEVMVNATFSLLEQCVEAGVDKVIMASSASVYGLADAFPTTEQAPPYPNRTLYGAAKAFGEHLLRAFNDMHGLDYVALRYFNVYGPRMDIHGRYTEVMIRWMERISKGQPPIIFGDGLSTMDFIHVSDVAKANLLAATAPVSDRVFNVGSGRETSLLDLARLLCEVMGRPDLVPVHVEQRAVNNVGRRLADVEAARRHLGFTAAVPLRRGLADLVAWWRTSQERADADVAGLPS